MIGDVTDGRAVVWSRADRSARLVVEYALSEDFRDATRLVGPYALEDSDFTARLDLAGLPAGREVFLRVRFQSLDRDRLESAPVLGRLRTPGPLGRPVRFVWSGDTGGQGFGIDLGFGGMKLYETMRREQPDFFIHCGDTVYADGPMEPEVRDGAQRVIWRNAFLDLEPAKLKVAETLDEFRANYRYNLLDENLRRFNAEVPQIWLWDDHETVNNWSGSKDLSDDDRYTEKRVPLLVARATRAFLDYAPLRRAGNTVPERLYRHIPYGDDLDVFTVDMRSYRGPNSYNRQEIPGPETDFLGPEQLAWLKRKLREARATWKVIAADMPLGLLIDDGYDCQGRQRFEGLANGDGPPLGRELELADLLRYIKVNGIRNVVWLTADVHYCAAHYYHPDQAVFRDFTPFWEFVAGPAHAGTAGPNPLDNTFGPRVVFQKTQPEGLSNLPPSSGYQFYGLVEIDPYSKELSVSLKDLYGETLFRQRLSAEDPVAPGGRS